MIEVQASIAELQPEVAELKEQLNLYLQINVFEPVDSFKLVLTPAGLELHWLEHPDFLPLRLCFVTGKQAWRTQQNGGRQEAIVRALGVAKGARPRVLDATAGLGRDAFVLAAAGCQVSLLERHPVVHALLDDAIQRASQDTKIGSWVCTRIHMLRPGSLLMESNKAQDSALIKNLEDLAPEAIYLDPMYPSRSKSAAVKKEMQILQALVGEDLDSDALLPKALELATHRVVVKRPIQAEFLNRMAPHSQVKSKKHRYDIYMKRPYSSSSSVLN